MLIILFTDARFGQDLRFKRKKCHTIKTIDNDESYFLLCVVDVDRA